MFCFSFSGKAVNRVVFGFSKDATTGKPIPFPKITIEGSRTEFMGDMEGNFTLSLPEGPQLVVVHAYQYLEAEITVNGEDSVKAFLY